MSIRTPSAPVRRLPVHFRSRRLLLSSARAEGAALTLGVPSETWLPEGTQVQVELSLEALERRTLEGVVQASPPAAWERGGRQLTVLFRGEAKRQAAELFAFCAGRPPEMGTASRPRYRTAIRCRVNARALQLKAEVTDLSATGAFVALRAAPGVRAGDSVELVLGTNLLGIGGSPLEARVMWTGEKGGVPGLGLRFVGDPARIQPALRRYLEGAAAEQ